MRQEVIIQQNGYHGLHFRATRITTQGGMTFPTLFNMAVDSVVWYWLSMIVKYEAVIHDGMGHAVGRSLGLFYMGDGIIGSWDLEWLQGDLNTLIGVFHQIVLMDNVAKSKTMTCQPGSIRLGMSEEAVIRRSTGK